jgi:hypothetical protein
MVDDPLAIHMFAESFDSSWSHVSEMLLSLMTHDGANNDVLPLDRPDRGNNEFLVSQTNELTGIPIHYIGQILD